MKEALLDSDTISYHLKGIASVAAQIEANYQYFGYLNLRRYHVLRDYAWLDLSTKSANSKSANSAPKRSRP